MKRDLGDGADGDDVCPPACLRRRSGNGMVVSDGTTLSELAASMLEAIHESPVPTTSTGGSDSDADTGSDENDDVYEDPTALENDLEQSDSVAMETHMDLADPAANEGDEFGSGFDDDDSEWFISPHSLDELESFHSDLTADSDSPRPNDDDASMTMTVMPDVVPFTPPGRPPPDGHDTGLIPQPVTPPELFGEVAVPVPPTLAAYAQSLLRDQRNLTRIYFEQRFGREPHDLELPETPPEDWLWSPETQ